MLKYFTVGAIVVAFLLLLDGRQVNAQLFPEVNSTNIPAANPERGLLNVLAGAQLLSADLDQDNDSDIIAMDPFEIWWYRNFDGQGSMNAAQKINLGSVSNNPLPTAVSNGDIDNDGDIDIVVAYETFFEEDNRRKIVIGWCNNTNGEGEYDEVQFIGALDRYVGYIKVIDYDQDGFNDILYGTDDRRNFNLNTQSIIGWFQNAGGDSFNQDSTILEERYISTLTVADLDNDQDPDIVYSLEEQGIYWIENGGSTSLFSEAVLIDEAVSTPFPLRVADVISGNEYKEILVGSRSDGTLHILSSNGTVFSIQNPINSAFNELSDIETSDLDNDGDLEVLVSSKTGISWFENIEDEKFGREHLIINPLWASAALFGAVVDLEVSDMNGDRMNDIVEISLVNITWYENEEGTFGTQNGINSNYGLLPSSFQTADFDSDDDLDILTSSTINGSSELWFENLNGKGKFSSSNTINSNNTMGFAGDVYVGDIDSDGSPDALSVDKNQGVTAWYRNLDGLGNFSPQRVITNQLDIQYLEVADIDGDGDNDILGTLLDQIVWYENVDGTGIFSNKQVIVEIRANRATAADLDNDGDIDIVFTESSGQKLSWVENLGEGDFSPAILIQEDLYFSNYPTLYVFSKDVEADGDMDLIVVSPVAQAVRSGPEYSAISWFENINSVGTDANRFSYGGSLINDVSGISEAIFTDLDLDGDYDIVASIFLEGGDRFEKALVWYENTDGNTTYSEHRVVIEPSQLDKYNIMAEDIDLDGDQDISLISGVGLLSWFENQVVPETFPKIGRSIPDLLASFDEYFQYTVSDLTFYDSTSLTLTVALADGSPLPPWLEFSSDEGKLRGTPSIDDMGVYAITITATNSKDVSVSTTFQLSVGQEVVPTISLEINNVSCYGGTDGDVTVSVANSDGSVTYSLDNDSFQESNRFIDLSAGTYTVYVNTESITYEREFTITEPDELILSDPIVQEPACPSDQTGSIEIVASGGAGSGYEYRIDEGNFVSNGVFRGLQAGTYRITARDASGCTVGLDVPVTSSNGALSIPTIRRSNESDFVDELSLIAENVPTGAEVQWYLNNNRISGATGLSVPITEGGSYYVEVRVSGCSEISEPIIINGIEDVIRQNLRIYPIPAREIIHAEIPLELTTGEVQATLMNAQGRVLEAKFLSSTQARKQVSFDISELPPGLYLISLQGVGFQLQKRITKQ